MSSYSERLVVLGTALLLAATGCSSNAAGPSNTPAATGPGTSATLDASDPTFAADVLPIFQASCAAGGAGCHGDPSVTTAGTQSRPFLGMPSPAALPGAGSSAASAIFNGLVGKASAEDPSMPLVTAGDPTRSFLLLKMDGTQDTQASACAAGEMGSCGLSMPFGSMLDQGTRDRVRAWIAMGANDD